MLKFTTAGKTYTAASLQRPTIRAYLQLAAQTQELGRKWTYAQVSDLEDEIDACKTAKERTDHPDFLTFLAFIVWATLLEEGVSQPYDKALDTHLDDLAFFYDPAPPVVPVDPSKPRAARATARGSRRPTDRKPAAKTSRTRSTPAS